MYSDDFRGIGTQYISRIESIREVNIINQIALDGNCITNSLGISSVATWFCQDKPFLMYGHAAVINARYKLLRDFLKTFTSETYIDFLRKYNISTVILVEDNTIVLNNYPTLTKHLRLLYMDPYMAILARNDTITSEQESSVSHFYSTFQPGIMDAMTFKYPDRVLQYVLLWFSAEITGNNGEPYLSVAERLAPPEKIARLKGKLMQLLAERTSAGVGEGRERSSQSSDSILLEQ